MEQLNFENELFSMDSTYFVAQANDLVRGKQNLKLNSIKLIRLAIMQISREDKYLKEYTITVPEIAKLFNVSANNIYRDIKAITDDILNNPVCIKEKVNGKTKQFIKLPWCTYCHYVEGKGLTIRLNDVLKPYLLNLQDNFNLYQLKDIMSMRSVYAIRIYEIIQSRIGKGMTIGSTKNISIYLKDLREACSCEDKFQQFGHFRTKVLDVAQAEINEYAMYNLTYSCVKKNRKVHTIIFHLTSKFKKPQ